MRAPSSLPLALLATMGCAVHAQPGVDMGRTIMGREVSLTVSNCSEGDLVRIEEAKALINAKAREEFWRAYLASLSEENRKALEFEPLQGILTATQSAEYACSRHAYFKGWRLPDGSFANLHAVLSHDSSSPAGATVTVSRLSLDPETSDCYLASAILAARLQDGEPRAWAYEMTESFGAYCSTGNLPEPAGFRVEKVYNYTVVTGGPYSWSGVMLGLAMTSHNDPKARAMLPSRDEALDVYNFCLSEGACEVACVRTRDAAPVSGRLQAEAEAAGIPVEPSERMAISLVDASVVRVSTEEECALVVSAVPQEKRVEDRLVETPKTATEESAEGKPRKTLGQLFVYSVERVAESIYGLLSPLFDEKPEEVPAEEDATGL